ncbi:PREDICTED: WAT1-related protein At1g09380 isoform X2 [Nelumbo nucifera]|uniref:WAT1-related protein n=1 Tax=Nelumbo nucifera TaxID=4432 RepID=A0A1U8ASF4_NELNU|nr:PREDICTED: WAT1-related protein At1g09380 isoform X2 [Nelumbo nucifera]
MMREFLPCIAMIMVQIGYAGMNILSKLAIDSGMSPLVMVTYRQIVATIIISPFAYFWERKTRPRITSATLFQIFLSSLFGIAGNQCLYFIGLKYSTPTIGCALTNLLPAVTFIMAVPFGMEKVGLRRKAGQAKVLGTVMCVGGAMLMSFYKGIRIPIPDSAIHWRYVDSITESGSSNDKVTLLGSLILIASVISWGAWFIMQAKVSETFSAPYSSTALMCLMGSIECGIIAVTADHQVSAWSLHSSIRLITSLYSGLVASAFAIYLMSWCIEKKGPLYVSAFSPLLLVIVAVIGWALLADKLYMGRICADSHGAICRPMGQGYGDEREKQC